MLCLPGDMTHLEPVPFAAVTGRANALRMTRARKAIAAVMNGADPDPVDVEATGDYRVDQQLLHLSAAAALRQSLMSRPSSARSRIDRSLNRGQQHLVDAYHLALALADSSDGDLTGLQGQLFGMDDWLEPALLLGKLQVRFLAQVCAQIQLSVEHSPVTDKLRSVTARQALADGGRITESTQLLEDHLNGEWLHATSTVEVNGVSRPVVVDAGPDLVTAAWAARVAAPITVTADSDGRWPVSAVRDALDICSDSVRWWVASMSRELAGDFDRDLELRIGPPLREFIVSPAAAAISAVIAADRPTPITAAASEGTAPAVSLERMPASTDTLLPTAPSERFIACPKRLALLRTGGEPGTELSPDTELDHFIDVSRVQRDEMTLLNMASPSELDEVEVTVNFRTPEYEDVTDLIAEVRDSGAVTLSAPVLAHCNQDTVSGNEHRVTLRALVRRGVALRTRHGYAVVLAAGTRLALLGADATKRHTTLYLQSDDEPDKLSDRSCGYVPCLSAVS